MRFRRQLAVLCVGASTFAGVMSFVAGCSNDETATGDDGGSGLVVPSNPTPSPTPTSSPFNPGPGPGPADVPDGASPPPDLISLDPTRFGNATLIADVGEATEGPAWRDRDSALYFTVPKSANPLRRVVPGGPVEIVEYDAGATADGGTRLQGLSTGGGDRIYATEPGALVTIDLDDAGAVAATSRAVGPGGTSFGEIAYLKSDVDEGVFFLDHTSTRVFRSSSDGGIAHLFTADAGSAKGTAIAIRTGGPFAFVQMATVGTGPGAYQLIGFGAGPEENGFIKPDAGFGRSSGVPANGIALTEDQNRVFIAYAQGLALFGSPTRLVVPIAAIPTCLTFGGADRKTLFVTTVAGKIYSVPVTTPGIPR